MPLYKTVFAFGDAKLRAQDIDPLYTALHKAQLPLATRQRYTLAEVAFDLAGIAAQIAEQPSAKFWVAMQQAARQTLRGAPRRYFRGHAAYNAIAALKRRYGTGEQAVAALQGTFADVTQEMKLHWPQFGPCAIFKLADMAERVCGNHIDFSACGIKEVCSNAQVAKGFLKACATAKLDGNKLLPAMQKYRWATKASPRFDRPLNAQEFETILCYYSHDDAHNKHLPGMDATGIRKELEGYGRLANVLTLHLPNQERRNIT